MSDSRNADVIFHGMHGLVNYCKREIQKMHIRMRGQYFLKRMHDVIPHAEGEEHSDEKPISDCISEVAISDGCKIEFKEETEKQYYPKDEYVWDLDKNPYNITGGVATPPYTNLEIKSVVLMDGKWKEKDKVKYSYEFRFCQMNSNESAPSDLSEEALRGKGVQVRITPTLEEKDNIFVIQEEFEKDPSKHWPKSYTVPAFKPIFLTEQENLWFTIWEKMVAIISIQILFAPELTSFRFGFSYTTQMLPFSPFLKKSDKAFPTILNLFTFSPSFSPF